LDATNLDANKTAQIMMLARAGCLLKEKPNEPEPEPEIQASLTRVVADIQLD